jgi:hypothetical protein
MYSGSRSLDAINADTDGHAAMHDEARPYAWEIWNAIDVA